MFIMVLVMLLIFSCALQCIKKLMAKMMQGIWMAQKQKGGFVGEPWPSGEPSRYSGPDP